MQKREILRIGGYIANSWEEMAGIRNSAITRFQNTTRDQRAGVKLPAGLQPLPRAGATTRNHGPRFQSLGRLSASRSCNRHLLYQAAFRRQAFSLAWNPSKF